MAEHGSPILVPVEGFLYELIFHYSFIILDVFLFRNLL